MDRLEQLVIDAARHVPDRVAVIDQHAAWTYAQLDASSARLARRLARRGVGAGDRVAVWAPKSCEIVAVLQAVLRLGAAYVPIDAATPCRRAERILDDCAARLVVTTTGLQARLSPGRPALLLDREAESNELEGEAALLPPGPNDRLAYILYTSGSTGTPKGVCLSHANARAFVDWAVRAVGLEGPAVVANHAAFNFDLSVFDLYGAFRARSTVCLVPDDIRYSAVQLAAFLARRNVAVLYAVPSAFILMMEHGGLLDAGAVVPDVAIFAGEPFPVRYLRRLRAHWPRTRLFNFYGPTETNVCTAHEVGDIPEDRTAPVPIGVASCGNRVWAVAEDGSVAGEGERGELYVEGPTVMLGYWGQAPHDGPHKTGDLCVVGRDGSYEFAGRRDHMIKVRGHRVELGEIEHALERHENVRQAAVLPVGAGLEQRLVAFLVPHAAPAPTLIELKRFCAATLPEYMLIDRVEVLDVLPLTPNGKVDRVALERRLGVRRSAVIRPAAPCAAH